MNQDQNTSKDKGTDESPMPELKPLPVEPMALPDLVDRLEELVKFSLENESKPLKEDVSFVDVYKQLMEIRRAIEILTEDQQSALSLFEGVGSGSPEEAPMNKQDKKLFNKIEHLKQTCEAARERAHIALQEEPEAEENLKEKIKQSTTSKKKKTARRKGKFRRVGGKKGWMPT